MKILFIAPSNSMHSFKWVSHFDKNKKCVVRQLSLYETERRFLSEFAPLMPIVLPLHKFKFLNFICTWMYAVWLTLRFKPDVIHGHSAGSHGLLAALLPSRNVMTTVWGSDILFAAQKWHLKPMVQFLLWRSRVVTCDAEHMVAALRKLGVASDRIKTINFGVDTNKLVPRPADSFQRALFTGGRDRKVVISLRNHFPVYDIPTLLRAAKNVLPIHPNVVFVIAGAGAETSKYRELCEEFGISDNVNFSGPYNGKQLVEIMSAADVYVSCSLSDAGIAASTAEAMSCGLPVVVSDTGENSLWIDHGVNGFLFAAGDDRALAGFINRVLADPELRRSVGLAGRETIVARNDYSSEMSKVMDLYKVIKNKRL
jgi:glycosyltransferase involved in cell wall biosynthesis